MLVQTREPFRAGSVTTGSVLDQSTPYERAKFMTPAEARQSETHKNIMTPSASANAINASATQRVSIQPIQGVRQTQGPSTKSPFSLVLPAGMQPQSQTLQSLTGRGVPLHHTPASRETPNLEWQIEQRI